MTMVVMPHSASGWAARVMKLAGGRTHLVRTALISVVLSVIAGVACALLAPGSHEFVTNFGDVPVWAQDEVRVEAEVWFTIVLSALAIITTILWWRPFVRRSEPDAVEYARGPIGLTIAAIAAIVQTAIAMLVWHPTVAMRGFAEPGEVGTDRIAAPILSSTTSLWVAAVCAVLTYLVLVILAPTSELRPDRTPARVADAPDPSN